VHFGATQLSGVRKDRGIVVTDVVSTAECKRGFKKLQGRFQNGECPPLAAESQRFFVSER